MKQSFLDYSMSVIVQRALPDVRDGLKPVHRRILYAMHEAGLTPARPFKKSATVVGDVLGKYHPHGDTAVYDAMVRMVQDFSLRYPLVEGQGNFGSIDGDSAAAYRYTEARLAPIAVELLDDIERDTVAFEPNFDDRLQEPVVLPSRVPNLLINGSSGIAVGMSTNIPPHNLNEVIEGCLLLLDNPDCTLDDLMEVIPGPDFPTGGLIVGLDGIRSAYETGRGRVVMQARIGRETRRGGREQLVVTEIPYATSKTRIIEQIATIVKKGKTQDISDLRDESDRDGIRLVIELKRGADAKKVLKALLKWTNLQSTFGVISLALDEGVPREFTLKGMLESFRDHRIEVIVRRSQWEKDRAEAEAHVLEGLITALMNIDRVVEIIRSSPRKSVAAERLIEAFDLSETQAEAILMMRLYRLTELETEDLKERLSGVRARIRELKEILEDPTRQVAEVRRELKELAEKYGDMRRTRIVEGKPEKMIESMVAQEDVVVAVSRQGYAKQIPMYLYRRRLTSGKPVAEMDRYADDYIEHLFPASTNDPLLFFTESGRAYAVSVADIPEVDRSSRGKPLQQLLGMEKEDRICTFFSLARKSSDDFLVFVTEKGNVKRTALDQFGTQRAGGVTAINLKKGDRLLDVHPSDGIADLLLASSSGRVIRFPETEVSEMGRTAQGVRGIKLSGQDRVVGSVLARRDGAMIGASAKGYALRIPLADFSAQKRDGLGTVAFPVGRRTGKLIGAKEVVGGDHLRLLGEGDLVVALEADSVPDGDCGTDLSKLAGFEAGASFTELTRAADAGPNEEPAPPLAGGDAPEAEAEAEAEVAEVTASPEDSATSDEDGPPDVLGQFDLLSE